MSKLEYHKLIRWKYTSSGIHHESLVSFHEANGTFSTVTCKNEDGCSLSACYSISSSSSISAIACSNDGERVAVGYKDGTTRIYSFTTEQLGSSSSSYHPFFTTTPNKDEFEYTAGPRFQSCVRALAFDPRSSSKNGYFLAVASEDYNCGVCVVNISMSEERYLVELSSSYGGVRSIAYTPTVENDTVLLAAIGMDGKLTIYTCIGLDQPDVYWDVLSREILAIIPTKDIGDSLRTSSTTTTYDALWAVEPIWSPDGTLLILPGSTDVQLRLRGDITKKYCIFSNRKEGHLLGDIVACAVNDSDLLVSVGRDGTTCVWKLHTDVIKKFLQDPSLPEETLGRFHKSWTTNEAPTSVVFTKDSSTSEDYICIQYANGNCQLHSKSSVMAEESKTKSGTLPQTKEPVSLDDDEEEEDKDEDSVQFDTQPPPPIQKTKSFVDEEAKEEDDVDDMSHPDAREETTTVGYNEDYHDDLEEEEEFLDTPNYIPNNKLPKPQEAFAPSSTPLHDDALDARRILCWNHVGVVTSRMDTGRGGGRIVDINFADVLTRGFKTFTDSYGFEIGTLSEEGGMFATLPEDENGSRIFYFRLETIGLQSKKDWTMILPDGEGALGCACGDGWAAVVTG